jgi:hypothetical protein
MNMQLAFQIVFGVAALGIWVTIGVLGVRWWRRRVSGAADDLGWPTNAFGIAVLLFLFAATSSATLAGHRNRTVALGDFVFYAATFGVFAMAMFYVAAIASSIQRHRTASGLREVALGLPLVAGALAGLATPLP